MLLKCSFSFSLFSFLIVICVVANAFLSSSPCPPAYVRRGGQNHSAIESFHSFPCGVGDVNALETFFCGGLKGGAMDFLLVAYKVQCS